MRRALYLLLGLMTACTFDPQGIEAPPSVGVGGDAEPRLDAALTDAEVPDLGVPEDAGPRDIGQPDLGTPDAGQVDAESPDAETPDVADLDMGVPDTGLMAVCGDGRIEGNEACDDMNPDANDGCTMCQVDTDWVCVLQPSRCVLAVDVAYVDGADPNCDNDGDGDGGNGNAPWCTIALGLGADPTPELVLVAPATYDETLLLEGTPDVMIVAPNGATWTSAGRVVTVKMGTDVLVSGFTILGTGMGGGVKVENQGSLLTLLDNVIGPANSRGVELKGGANLVMRRNLVRGQTEGGVYLDSDQGYILVNNVVEGCGATDGDWGGVRIKKTHVSARFVNNTVANNVTRGEPAGVRCDVDTSLINVVVWGNTGDLASEVSARCGPQYSLLQAAVPGTGNLSMDPILVGPQLELGPNSPAIDTGDPAGVRPGGPAPPEDFSHRRRPQRTRVDMGAHEML